ncbi:helix-turn-helix domain-containing protein [Novosphingobium mangrovi (ex Huang et al. 2023)]|uniref:DUF4019 domain-containing protein n=1 Tax=Novosphingobium mangrovi (ex Huang et al. 2023) TaxID=2976432 RepID=A0ABT2I444_9SPHN|nr:DUF4019 domain-containing protein [Novosphingobium mangrovi (ex Huang et al. 2023)]MCT2399357.1 DUF4019 domain-containing protein [Novosphingobium mangrovi (ex Huang et al. 2023)]
MTEGIETLSERERETLRLLLGGHDAKSIARELGLSVHTINERLREARKKLGVSSSREAARRLAESERATPHFLGDKVLGDAGAAPRDERHGQSEKRQTVGYRLVWLGGGMLIMSLIIAAAVLSSTLAGSASKQAPLPEQGPVAESVDGSADAVVVQSARAWVSLLDEQHWSEAWHQAGTAFRSKITDEQWVSIISTVRNPLGATSWRTVQSVLKTNAVPNAPKGEYRIIKFQTDFAQKNGAIETVVLFKEGADWKVDGYFIR